MASPIPTQLSPGVKVSEVDLSQFVLPPAGNVAGMVGVFNWGPALVSSAISTESDLAAMYGNPTFDQSDVNNNGDFLAAANFLKYSSNLRVVRVLQGNDTNSTSQEAGITAITSCTIPTISNLDQFRKFGGFSGYNGIEATANFRARYPGNFGDSLKVIVWDGATGESVTQTTAGIVDIPVLGGYNPVGVSGITSGSIGFTLTAFGQIPVTDPVTGDVFIGIGVIGTTSGTHTYTIVTVVPDGVADFLNPQIENSNSFNIAYATGTTTANFNLTSSGSVPSGNSDNYYTVLDASSPVNANGVPFNPFATFRGSKPVFAKQNLNNSAAVDIMFLNADSTNMNSTITLNKAFPGTTTLITDVSFITSGIPSNFGSLVYLNPTFFTYRDTWSRVSTKLFNSTTGTPSTSLKGWGLMVGLTGGATFWNPSNGASGTIGVTFDTVGGLTGVQRDFQFGIKQFVSFKNNVQTTGRETFNSVRLFDKVPNTSAYASQVGGSNDEISFAVIDTVGKFGPKNSILEKFELLSKAVNATNLNGESIYYKDFINNNSQYVYMTKPFGLSGGGNASSDATTAFGDILYSFVSAGTTLSRKGYYESQLAFGTSSGMTATPSEYLTAYNVYTNDDDAVDILFVPESSLDNDTSTSDPVVEQIAYNTVVAPRTDTILVIPTPPPASITQHSAQTTSNTISFRKNNLNIPSNSYTILVAGRKVFFDTYNNQIRKMALSSDVAGILAAQEIPWESPAGFARGNLKNVINLETKFSKIDRDNLYKNQINFFTEFTDGSGTVLFGDKTLLTKPSAFDRINVRRVFIAIEKAIASASKYSLFEFNDEFTRAQFRNLVTPYLRSMVAQRGIAEYKVVCDETNNTPQVIDNNQFVADIYIKPLKSINFIQLNFIAVKSGFELAVIE